MLPWTTSTSIRKNVVWPPVHVTLKVRSMSPPAGRSTTAGFPVVMCWPETTATIAPEGRFLSSNVWGPAGSEPTVIVSADPIGRGGPTPSTHRSKGPVQVPPVVIACSHQLGATHEQVAGVRARYERQPITYGAIFDQVDALSAAGAKALVAGDYAELGELMNVCQGLLNALGVSTPELERMVDIARKAGAAGAKLTGGGGGGSIVALCPGTVVQVVTALHAAGYSTIELGKDR